MLINTASGQQNGTPVVKAHTRQSSLAMPFAHATEVITWFAMHFSLGNYGYLAHNSPQLDTLVGCQRLDMDLRHEFLGEKDFAEFFFHYSSINLCSGSQL